MNAKSCCLILAAGLMTTAIPGFAQSQNNNATQNQNEMRDQMPGQNSANGQWQNSQGRIRGQREADKMVPARAVFTETLESDKAQPGANIQAKLTKNVTLHDGTKLPSGTLLLGSVVRDNTQPGMARLAVRFNQARLKDGQTIPVKATIVGIYNTPDADDSMGYWGGDPNSIPPSWNDGTLQIDQINALPGIDLHSKVASPNSGVFVSKKKDDIKLSPSYSLTVAIADRQNRGMNGNSAENGSQQNGNGQYARGHNGYSQNAYPQTYSSQSGFRSENTMWQAGSSAQTGGAYTGSGTQPSGTQSQPGMNQNTQNPGTMNGTSSTANHSNGAYTGATNSGTAQSQANYGQGNGTSSPNSGTSGTGAYNSGTSTNGTSTTPGAANSMSTNSAGTTGTTGAAGTTGASGAGPR